MSRTRWVSCSRDTHHQVAQTRHLVVAEADLRHAEAITTLCGSTGVGQGVWRANTTKAACSACLARAQHDGLHVPTTGPR